MKIQQLQNKQHFICLPRKLVTALDWKKGDVIDFKFDVVSGKAYLIKKEEVKNEKDINL